MSDLKLKDRRQQANIHAVSDRNDVFFLPSFDRVCYHFLLTIGIAYLVVRRDVEPGSLLTLQKVFVGERWLSHTSFVPSLV